MENTLAIAQVDTALSELMEQGEIPATRLARAIEKYAIKVNAKPAAKDMKDKIARRKAAKAHPARLRA